MSFNNMIKDLVAKGLLDQDHKLTPKGHEEAEKIKKEYSTKTYVAAKKVAKKEQVFWPMKWG